MLKRLIKLANHLDSKGLTKEADLLDSVATKIAHELFKAEMGCGEDVEDELYYLENLSDMYEDMEHEEDPHDLVDT
jgi:hypothetical protein